MSDKKVIAQDPEDQAAYDEYFAKGRTITVCDTNARTEDLVINPWRGRGRPKAKPAAKAKK
jgi:hypothetical protein